MRKFVPFIAVVILLGLLLGGISQNQAAAQPQVQPQVQAQTNICRARTNKIPCSLE